MRLRSLSLRLAEQKAADEKAGKSGPATSDPPCESRQVSTPMYYRVDGADNQDEMNTSASTNCYYGDHDQIQVQQSGCTSDNMHGSYLYHENVEVESYLCQQQAANDGSQACEQAGDEVKHNAGPECAYTGLDQQFAATQDTTQAYAGKDGIFSTEGCRNPPYQDYMGLDSAEEDLNGSPTSTDHEEDDASRSMERDIPKPINKKNLKRHRLSHSETRFLLNQFGQNPHPDAAQRVLLSKQINGLSVRQIQVWFQNRRAKLKRMSASDADRMLSTRSYPDGYGPQGFENQAKRQESPQDASPCLTKADISFPSQECSEAHVLQPKTDSASLSQYPIRNISSSYSAQSRQLGFVRDGTNSPYPEAATSRGAPSPQGSPAQYDATTYGLPLRASAVQSSARFVYGRPYPSPHAMYGPRSVQTNNSFVNSPEDTPVVQSPYRPYSMADQRGYYTPSLLATPTYQDTGYRQVFNVAEQVSDYHAPGQDGPYIMTTAQPHPLGYNQHVPANMDNLYSDVRAIRSHQMTSSSPEDNYHQAPPMQREVKCAYPDDENTRSIHEDYVDTPQYYGRDQNDCMESKQHEMTYAAHLQQATFHQRQVCQQDYNSDDYIPDPVVQERDQAQETA
ncbi:putative Homeobox transcription factor [Taphrina deformans PYCC 5710]|uniref:Homeobox transcription factor n=1 Tax=Taphrina deformans (strain PYCC 5710 / ATCC 11124 / CBS 356.35 / IMI 108563 / JCM 9778 / NBRC 8474) TaxID=1097556 RepID=R4XBJ9_TAPDE|nr:putative Homeobox transcription factor [Taphrina deformans PYCC 5710]|eukprot:CCG82965.1 putative Homeobox transcription factor [Taphrina deformans PYCC 5710]